MAGMKVAKRFSDEAANKGRLIQAWVILVGKARNRQTITYAQLANVMHGAIKPLLGKRAGQWKGMQLGQLLTYCKDRSLPLLPVIVITKKTGLPADTAPYSDPNAERELVFNFDWYDLHPPVESDLEDGDDAHSRSRS